MVQMCRLNGSDGSAFHIWGSSELLQTLIASELVDEYRICFFTLVLGEGKRLFENRSRHSDSLQNRIWDSSLHIDAEKNPLLIDMGFSVAHWLCGDLD